MDPESPTLQAHFRIGKYSRLQTTRGVVSSQYLVFALYPLSKYGLDTDEDFELKLARDDTIRMGLLRQGAVDVALISSAASPVTICLSLISLLFLT